MYVSIEEALVDLLREYGITLNDLLAAMRYEDIDVYGELIRRIDSPGKDIVAEIQSYPWRLVALTLFVLQAFYIVNPSGLYKGLQLDPPRSQIMRGFKASPTGIRFLIKRLKNLT